MKLCKQDEALVCSGVISKSEFLSHTSGLGEP